MLSRINFNFIGEISASTGSGTKQKIFNHLGSQNMTSNTKKYETMQKRCCNFISQEKAIKLP